MTNTHNELVSFPSGATVYPVQKCGFCGAEAYAVLSILKPLTKPLIPLTYVCKDCFPTGKPAEPKKFIDLTIAEISEAIQKSLNKAIEDAGKETLKQAQEMRYKPIWITERKAEGE